MGVMRDVLPRLGELESMLETDLNPRRGTTRTLTLTRQPQGGLRGKTPEPETVALSAETDRHLDLWPRSRTDLMTRLQGGVLGRCRAGQAGRRWRVRGRVGADPGGDDAPHASCAALRPRRALSEKITRRRTVALTSERRTS